MWWEGFDRPDKGFSDRGCLGWLPAASTPPTTGPHHSALALTSPGALTASEILTSPNEGGCFFTCPVILLAPFYSWAWKCFKVKIIWINKKTKSCMSMRVIYPELREDQTLSSTHSLLCNFKNVLLWKLHWFSTKSHSHLQHSFAGWFFLITRMFKGCIPKILKPQHW